MGITDCEKCTRNLNCGWCTNTTRCLPGRLGPQECKDMCKMWNFEEKLCNLKSMGSLPKVSPEATHMITP
jgi:hypothetical protein